MLLRSGYNSTQNKIENKFILWWLFSRPIPWLDVILILIVYYLISITVSYGIFILRLRVRRHRLFESSVSPLSLLTAIPIGPHATATFIVFYTDSSSSVATMTAKSTRVKTDFGVLVRVSEIPFEHARDATTFSRTSTSNTCSVSSSTTNLTYASNVVPTKGKPAQCA